VGCRNAFFTILQALDRRYFRMAPTIMNAPTVNAITRTDASEMGVDGPDLVGAYPITDEYPSESV
jgi:hypothetical protein